MLNTMLNAMLKRESQLKASWHSTEYHSYDYKSTKKLFKKKNAFLATKEMIGGYCHLLMTDNL